VEELLTLVDVTTLSFLETFIGEQCVLNTPCLLEIRSEDVEV
jgi:hypothetical protein